MSNIAYTVFEKGFVYVSAIFHHFHRVWHPTEQKTWIHGLLLAGPLQRIISFVRLELDTHRMPVYILPLFFSSSSISFIVLIFIADSAQWPLRRSPGSCFSSFFPNLICRIMGHRSVIAFGPSLWIVASYARVKCRLGWGGLPCLQPSKKKYPRPLFPHFHL